MVHADVDPGKQRILVTTQWRDKERVKLVPGARWDRTEKTWHTPLTWASCKQLRGVFREDLTVGNDLLNWSYHEYESRILPTTRLRSQMELDEHHPVGLLLDTLEDGSELKLFGFQRVGSAFMALARQALLADEMGTGKTPQTIRAVQLLQRLHGDALPALVVCPNSMKRTWEREILRWTDLRPQVVTGGAATRRKQLREEADVYVVNWESLRIHSRLAGYGSLALTEKEKEPKELNEVDWGTVVADEAHRAKNPKAKQTRALWAVGDQARYRYALTGTPIASTPDDLWSIMRFVDSTEWPSKTRYVDRYCLSSWNPFGGLDVIGVKPETRDEFFSILDPRFLRRPKSLVLPQLPPKIRQQRLVELSAKQKKAYDKMRDEYVALLDDGDATIATNPLVHLTRLSQFASAYAEVDDEGKIRLTDPSCKVDALEEILDENDGQVVVFAESRQLIELAEARLERRKIDYVSIRGGVSESERTVNIDAFQDGRVRVCLVTLGAGGEGITLTAASVAVFLQRSWSMIKNKQGEDRIHRPGQTAKSVLYVDVIAEGTVEEYRDLRLKDKEDRLEEIVRDKSTLRAMLKSK